MAAEWSKSLSRWIEDGFIRGSMLKAIWDVSPPKTTVVPKKGMLVREDRSDRYYGPRYALDDPNGGQYFCILDALVDDYGRCKFKYLSSESIKWTSWMSMKEFNNNYQIQNPWV